MLALVAIRAARSHAFGEPLKRFRDGCLGAVTGPRIGHASCPSPARAYRPGRVQRARWHGGGALPTGVRPYPATRRWRVGAGLASLVGAASAHRPGDPGARAGDGSVVPGRGNATGLSGATC
jgi:hypothetical protein